MAGAGTAVDTVRNEFDRIKEEVARDAAQVRRRPGAVAPSFMHSADVMVAEARAVLTEMCLPPEAIEEANQNGWRVWHRAWKPPVPNFLGHVTVGMWRKAIRAQIEQMAKDHGIRQQNGQWVLAAFELGFIEELPRRDVLVKHDDTTGQPVTRSEAYPVQRLLIVVSYVDISGNRDIRYGVTGEPVEPVNVVDPQLRGVLAQLAATQEAMLGQSRQPDGSAVDADADEVVVRLVQGQAELKEDNARLAAENAGLAAKLDKLIAMMAAQGAGGAPTLDPAEAPASQPAASPESLEVAKPNLPRAGKPPRVIRRPGGGNGQT